LKHNIITSHFNTSPLTLHSPPLPLHPPPDVKDETITLTDDKLVFNGKSGADTYTCDLEFFAPCDSSSSTYKVLPRSVQMYVVKKDAEADFWPRLLKDKLKEKNQIKIDWDRYVDDDEEEEAGEFDTSGMGGQMTGAPPGMEVRGGEKRSDERMQ